MAVYQLYSHCVACKYKNTLCSKAFVFVFICLLLTYIPPFFVVYGSDAFWLRTEIRREKPDVHFKHEFLLVLETNEFEIPTICSTIENLQFTTTEKNICSANKVLEEDIDKDGKYDYLSIEIQVPLTATEVVYHVKMFLLFDYRLSLTSNFQMESMGFIEKSSSWAGGARLDIYGDLRLHLKEPITSHGTDSRYNKTIFKAEQEVTNIQSVLDEYTRRNVSTHIFPVNALWTFGRSSTDPFILTAKIHYPEEQVVFYTSIFEALKWAWIQYLAFLWPFLYAFQVICSWVFKHRLINAGITFDPPINYGTHKKFF
ncbi:hypothetical protein J437_LFUL015873 [Ladona fulva]|uniref:Transmembrane protein 231 n=1 Tax=Ladona fulva TaxID=123851 RepID=A0A8K0P6Z8_LADFU|nr:hypothetical protein J437_LFUL015873 [Ladona fulva]